MRYFRLLLVSLLFPLCLSAVAQQSAAKPVLSAAPAAEPPPPPPLAANVPGPPATDPSYVIGPDDSISISVFESPNLSASSIPVRPDGRVSLPLIGDIQAAGYTPTQLAANITAELKKFVVDPVVNVTVNAVNSKRIFLYGEISRVGPLSLTPGMTILQAIASAGGPTPYADRKHIYILRGEPGKQKKIFFDLKKAVKTGNMQGIVLMPGDTIVFP